MNNKLVVTNYKSKAENRKGILTALYENDKIVELNFEEHQKESILGNIYIGKVKNIVPNIQAAFVEIAPGRLCYYSFEDNKHPIIVSGERADNRIVAGAELLVQVSKENIKTKAPVVTSNLNFTGKYLVLTSGNRRIGISGKITGTKKAELKQYMKQFWSDEYGFVVRTNAGKAAYEAIEEEAIGLIGSYKKLLEIAAHRTCYSLLHEPVKGYLEYLKNVYVDGLQTIVTDDKALYAQMERVLQENHWDDIEKLSLYEDESFPLQKLYSLETEVAAALHEKVWLGSGAYLIIQNTEALTVIDVNTGKYNGRKNIQETFLKINIEAAKEIARQIRLRNLSGIIVIDFIDLQKKEAKQQLLEQMQKYLRKDPVKTNLVGMTSLQLVEITRKKIKKPLKEQLTYPCPVCGGTGCKH